VKKIAGGSVSECAFIDGILCRKNVAHKKVCPLGSLTAAQCTAAPSRPAQEQSDACRLHTVRRANVAAHAAQLAVTGRAGLRRLDLTEEPSADRALRLCRWRRRS
jgi:hypothetical protein